MKVASFREAAMEVTRFDVLWMYFQVKGNKICCRLGTEFDVIYVIINFFFFLLTSSCKIYFENLNIHIDWVIKWIPVYPSLRFLLINLWTHVLWGEVRWGEVSQSCPTLCDPVDCNLLGCSVHGILQARIMEWIAISFSRGSSRPRDRTWVSRTGGTRFNCLLLNHFCIFWIVLKQSRHITSPTYCFVNISQYYEHVLT